MKWSDSIEIVFIYTDDDFEYILYDDGTVDVIVN